MSTTGKVPQKQKRKKKTTRGKVKKLKTQTAPPPTTTPTTTVPTPVKVKKRKFADISQDLGRPLDTQENRYAANAEANRTALDRIYDNFYDADGNQEPVAKRRRRVYSFMGKGTTDYLKAPVTGGEFDSFVQDGRDAYTVTSQSLGREESEKDPDAVKAKLTTGDYFRVYNDAYAGTKAQLKGKARRIIVNVKTQKAALQAAKALTHLYANPAVSPYFRQFKVYLSGKQGDTAKVKYDKLVVYYRTGDEDGSTDKVGDAIASAVDSAVKPTDRETAFAPFYSRVAPGIAWAEEPKYYVDKLKKSFTRTRSNIIASVIKKNTKVASKAAFAKLVTDAFAASGIDTTRPQRHITT